MQKLALLSSLAMSAAMLAQNPCTPPGNTTNTLSGAQSYGFYLGSAATYTSPTGSVNIFFDLNASANINLTGFDATLYDYSGVPGPVTTGQQFNVIVWTIANTWAGNQNNQGAWNNAGTGVGTVAGNANTVGNSPIVLNAPIFLSAGVTGVVIEMQAVTTTPNAPNPWSAVHPLLALGPVGNPPWTDSDAYITVQNQGLQRDGWGSGVLTASGTYGPVHNAYNLYYQVAAGAAYYNSYGHGCGASFASFFETYLTAGSFDLSNYSIDLINAGNAYVVQVTPGAPTWFTPTSTSLSAGTYQSSTSGSWDDAISQPITLPFTFNYPGGSTSTIEVGSNGICLLQHDTNGSAAYGYYNDTTGWLNKPANFAVCFGDQDCGVNGTSPPGNPYGVYFDVDPSGNQVYVTWITQEWSPAIGPTQNFQLMMDNGGNAEFRYQQVNMNAAPAPILVGWTPGGGAAQPPQTDLDTVGGFVTGTGTVDLAATMSARPITGTTPNFVTSGLQPGNVLGAVVLGFGPLNPGVDLGFLGAPGCTQNMAVLGASITFLSLGATTPQNIGLPIPNNPLLAGLTVTGQSALLVPGINALGVTTSNGVCIGLGTF